MPLEVERHIPRYRVEARAIRGATNKFIDTCLSAQTNEQRAEQVYVEQALMAVQDKRVPRISSEFAKRLYGIRLALNTLYERYSRGDFSKQDLSLLLSLGYELMKTEGYEVGVNEDGKLGIIPAITHIKKKEGHIPSTFLYPPDIYFTDPLLDYLADNQPPHDAERTEQGDGISYTQIILDVLAFAHDIYRWNTVYLQHHRDVGVIPPETFSIENESQRNREKARQRKLRGPEANYLIHWRAIPFRLYQGLCEENILDFLSVPQCVEALHGILIEQEHEILYGGYYNPELLEKIPRKREALQTLRIIKNSYGTESGVPLAIRIKVQSELKNLVNDPDFPFPSEKRSLWSHADKLTDD